jgi:hypothetical protein
VNTLPSVLPLLTMACIVLAVHFAGERTWLGTGLTILYSLMAVFCAVLLALVWRS